MSCKQPLKHPPHVSALPGSGCPPTYTSYPAKRGVATSCPSSRYVSDWRAPTVPAWKDRATKCLLPSTKFSGNVTVSVDAVSIFSLPFFRYTVRQGSVSLLICNSKPLGFRLRMKKEMLKSAPRLSARVKEAKLVEFSRPNVAAGCSGRKKKSTSVQGEGDAAGTEIF